jgi:tight adherence protein B
VPWQARALASAVPRHLAVALAAGALIGLVTGWPVGALLAGLAGYVLPGLFAQQAATPAAIARLEGLATLTENLYATLQATAGLEQAVTITAKDASEGVRAQAAALVDKLEEGVPLGQALREWADDLNDPEADAVVGSLLMAVEYQGAEVGESLSALASAAWERAIFYRRTQAAQAGTRTDVRTIVGIFAFFVLALSLVGQDILDVYDTAQGQAVLAFVGACFLVGYRWLVALATAEVPSRFVHAQERRR